MKAVEDARLYLVATARLKAGRLAELVPDLVGAGVDLVQLRGKELDGGRVLELGAVHLGQDDVPADLARRMLGNATVGRSTHSREQLSAALAATPRPNYVAVGPVFATPTKPGRPFAGLGLVRFAAEAALGLPWFAIGGINETNLDEVMGAGARRVVVVRAITESDGPVAATARLKQQLEGVPLKAR